MSTQFPFTKIPMELQGVHGKYTISREDNKHLKRGYMSVIYLVRDVENKLFALKTLWKLKDPTESELENWKKAAHQFNVEISTLEKLQNTSGIIQVRDRGEHEGAPWYVMDYIPGSEITEGLKGKPLHVRIKTLRKMVKALSVAHQKGIVHMDLKPSNILLDQNNDPVVLDFGVSKIVEIAWQTISVSTGLFGTPRYMAPEQFNNQHKNVDLHQIDIWSTGVLFYEILVENHPLGVDEGDTYNQMADKIIHNEVYDFSVFDKSIDRSIAEICYRALSKEKSQRYKNASEMLDHLNQWERVNFDKCIQLAEEYTSYQHWQEAINTAIEAHCWSPFHPKIRECLRKALSKDGEDLVVDWSANISSDMISFWLKTRNQDIPKNIARIFYIHNEPPEFIATSPKIGTNLPEILKQREEMGEPGILQADEAILLVKEIQRVIDYAKEKSWDFIGLEAKNIYCSVDQQGAITHIYFWGFGWKGNIVGRPIAAIRTILKSVLSDKNISMNWEVEKALENSSSTEDIIEALKKQILQDEQDDEDDYF